MFPDTGSGEPGRHVRSCRNREHSWHNLARRHGDRGVADPTRIRGHAGTLSDLERAAEFEAIVIGSDAEGAGWPAVAREACRHHAPALKQRLVWLFSGPAPDDSTNGNIDLSELAETVTARDYKYFPATDTERILSWTAFIADELLGHS